MNKIVTVGVVLAAALVMIGCKNSEGMEEAENRRAQASAMVVAGMKRLNVAEFSGKAGESLAEAKLCGHGSVSPEERALLHRMQEIRLVAISFRPPATLKDAVEFFHLASAPVGEREKAIDIRVDAVTDAYGKRSIPEIKAFDIPLYDAIKLIADSTGFRLEIRGNQVVLKECDGCKLSMVKFGDENNDDEDADFFDSFVHDRCLVGKTKARITPRLIADPGAMRPPVRNRDVRNRD